MWQRIQTLYLLLVVVLMASLLFFPMGSLSSLSGGYIKVGAMGVSGTNIGTEHFWGGIAYTLLIVFLALAAIFLYKWRILQIRFCIYNAILMLCFYGLFAYLVHVVKHIQPEAVFGFKIPLAFPFISLVLDYLAIRGIGADETMVRGAERLRSSRHLH
ncbi:MAG: DUF4293 domain-containing protein [Tannerella sp.]|jgi:hypothetical protein|nr:DUF4293 domain-containing protein [Tannerella sp.]